MNIQYFENEEQLALFAADLIVTEIKRKPNLLLGAATGNTPTATYQKMVEKLKNEQTTQLRILKLDEWGGVSMSNQDTCEQYLQEQILKPLQISKERYFGFNSNPKKPTQETKRIQEVLKREKPIDLCILGLGLNGHIAFNEPANKLKPHCHIAHLSEKSMQHSMAIQMKEKPTYGLTLGMVDILRSKTILILITGNHKKEITKTFLSKEISTQIPASFLWLHQNVHCFADKAVLG